MELNHQPPKKVLIIAHEFPPFSGGFVMRALKFSKYLHEFGWCPVVLAANPDDCYFGSGWGRDPSLLNELHDGTILAYASSPMERALSALRGKLRGKQAATQSSPHLNVNNISKPGHNASGLLRKFHVFQDQSGLWNPYAYAAARKLIAKHKVDAVLTTSPPPWVHLVGYQLKRKTGLPWIADFRDGWIENPIFQAQSPARQRFERWQENRVIANADIVLGVTSHIIEILRQNHPDHQQKIRLLHNGFDPADFLQPPPLPGESCISFIHLGNIGGVRDPHPLLAGFQQLILDGSLRPDQICVQFIGQAYGLLPEHYSPVHVEIIPTVNHREAVTRMQSAGVLVLIAGAQEGKGAFTSKVFEYLAARRPILAIVPPVGELNDLLSSYSQSVIASPDNPEQIRAGILDAVHMAAASRTLSQSDESIISQFDRRLQTGKLASILDTLVLP